MTCYDVKELKKMFFEYFINVCGHTQISSHSLVPKVDNSVLFTPAGMHPLIPYLTGKHKHPGGNKLVNVQEVVRTGAIDKVGIDSYLTFFELFGAWTIGDYSKHDTLLKVWDFLTSKSYLGVSPEQIYITYFKGNDFFPKDIDTLMTWKEIGVAEDHLCETSKNWKGPYSSDRICGPNTRIFYDTNKPKCSSDCNVLCGCGKYVELWDVVFLDYVLTENGVKKAPCGCVDMGAGVERIASLIQNVETIYQTDILDQIVNEIITLENNHLGQNDAETAKKRRIVADHFRCACFVLGDEITTLPSNKGRGYVLRKILRRAINNTDQLGIGPDSYYYIVNKIIDLYECEYPMLNDKREYIINQICIEYEIYKLNIGKNLLQVEKQLNGKETISYDEITRLFNTYGVPIDFIKSITNKKRILIEE